MRTNITAESYWRAVKPLLDLLDLSPFEVYDFPVGEWGDDGTYVLHFRKVVDRDAPREDWPIVAVGEEPGAELAYDVRIPLGGGFRPSDLWSYDTRPRATLVDRGV